MAQISQTLYNEIADAYADIQDALSNVSANARLALESIVDVDTDDYPDPSHKDADAALEIELALLQIFNSAYVGSKSIALSTSSLLSAVSALNDFVVINSSGTTTVEEKMLTWINTTMSGFWNSNYCPDGWANFCSDAGYSITGWHTNSYHGGVPA